MTSRAPAFVLAAVLALTGCGGARRAPDLPPPTEATTVGVGDVFEMRIVGEEKLPTTFTVAPDGSVDLPYIKRIHVAGLEPQEVVEVVRKKLMEDRIYRDPSVSIAVTQYNSKRVEVLGEVKNPGSLPLQPGMTLLRAISIAGGLNAIADKDGITIRRRVNGQVKAYRVSVSDIIDNNAPDIPLQAGDSINVEQRVF